MTDPRRDGLRSDRLVLRRWTDADRAPFGEINRDPVVRATLGPAMTQEQSDDFVERIETHFDSHGWGLWCVERHAEPGCIGYVGLWPVPPALPFAPAVEIGWRLASGQWGNGYATEAARAVLADAFGRLGLRELVSMTAEINARSRAVMERIGLERDPSGDFEHPNVPADSRLRRHVLYRLRVDRYRAGP